MTRHAARVEVFRHRQGDAGKPVRISVIRGLMLFLFSVLVSTLAACGDHALNNPYPLADQGEPYAYTAFINRPKHLDPVSSYESTEYKIIGNIYEPPLQYHFLKRPYQLEPLTAAAMPTATLLDKDGKPLPAGDSQKPAFTRYTITIKKGIRYQPHPAFAKDGSGKLRYHGLREADLKNIWRLSDFKYSGSRELVAADYVYQMKRLAHPRVHSPIFSLMAKYIVGLREYGKTLKQADRQLRKEKGKDAWLDLRKYPLAGVRVVDRYTYTITIKGQYPQLLYWMAMPFFSPVPFEAERFYSQAGMQERNFKMDWYPVGTGAYMLTVNDPNRVIILEKNPNYRPVFYPAEGMPGDREAGYLDDAGKRLPFITKLILVLDKEQVPRWNKFLQGYYDYSVIPSDNFDQAVTYGDQGAELTPFMTGRGIRLTKVVEASTFYMGFNMKDPVVGGSSERARKLRRAIAIAVDYEEFISIFQNGRGLAAQSPLPPGIFGYQQGKSGINPYVYTWKDGKPQRRTIGEARKLLAEAGYPNGRDSRTGKPLQLYYDTVAWGSGDRARWAWFQKQFRKLNIDLEIRSTDYNRFQEKIRKGNAQIFTWGWNADYPDPENFFFLLYGPNGRADHHGENTVNYRNPEFDRLFEKMETMQNGPERLVIIRKMLAILQKDSPWLWGFHSVEFGLYHRWYTNVKPMLMGHNTLQYRRLDAGLRAKSRQQWNRPVRWPMAVIVLGMIVLLIPAVIAYRRREHEPMYRRRGD